MSRATHRAEWLLWIYGDRRVVRCILLPDEIEALRQAGGHHLARPHRRHLLHPQVAGG
jgi:hypothetical protein